MPLRAVSGSVALIFDGSVDALSLLLFLELAVARAGGAFPQTEMSPELNKGSSSIELLPLDPLHFVTRRRIFRNADSKKI